MDYEMTVLLAAQQQQQQQLLEQAEQAQSHSEAMEEAMGDVLNGKQKNTLPVYGNKETMNINPMILSNIQGSAYFKEELYKMKTFHEVIDEIFYKVEHLEPWEKGSRKLAGQVGMCGGVRGVAAGGIVSSAYCLLFKLFTLKLTRRQVQAMLDHVDSPFIRGLGFMYIRYCQPPLDLWDWFEPYLDDPEEIDLKAGGGFKTTVGAMCRMMLIKLDWFGTMLPRISVSVSKTLQQKLTAASQPDRALPGDEERRDERENGGAEEEREREKERAGRDVWGEAARRARPDQPERREKRSPPPPAKRSRSQSRDRDRRDNRRRRSRSRERRRSHSREKPRRRSRSRSRDRRRRSSSRERRARSRSRSKERGGRRRSRSRDRRRSRSRERKRKSRSTSRNRRRR